ncbi:type IV pilin protein [Synechococcus sp. MIT S1220]|uniref:type IV pilin protein n=1 Tax=Synechococcus sp. MIT S1220 TaxID=3082549 RepID=UPI0039AF7343
MTSLNSKLQLALLNRKKGRNLLEKGFTLVELMIVIVIVGILSAVALPNFLSQTGKAKLTEPQGKLSAAFKQAQAVWVEDGNFDNITCESIGLATKADGTDAAGTCTDGDWTYTFASVDASDGSAATTGSTGLAMTAAGIAGQPSAGLGLTRGTADLDCMINGPTGAIAACVKDTDTSS